MKRARPVNLDEVAGDRATSAAPRGGKHRLDRADAAGPPPAYPSLVVWWIVAAVFVAALLVLMLAVRPVLARLGGLRRAVTRLQQRQAQALALQEAAEALNERVVQLGEQVEAANRRRAASKARRD
jgi:flagellar biosynthesis/type III secretory pathway M-ring protein FliF/YscJ